MTVDKGSRFRWLLGVSALALASTLAQGCSPETTTQNEPSEQAATVGHIGNCAANDLQCQTAALVDRRRKIDAMSHQASITVDTADSHSELGHMWFAYYDYKANHRFFMEFVGSNGSNQFTVRRWICPGAPFQGSSFGCSKFSENVLNGSRVNAWADANVLNRELGRTVTGDLSLNLDGAAEAAFYDPSLKAARKAFFGLDDTVTDAKAGQVCNSQCAGESKEHTIAVGLIFLVACSFGSGGQAIACAAIGTGFGIFGGRSMTACYQECTECFHSMEVACESDSANAVCFINDDPTNNPFKCQDGKVVVKGVMGTTR
jgi:hypothetical protein